MKRGDLYRVRRPTGDPKRSRVFVVVGRQTVIDSRLSTVVCAPVLSQRGGLSTEVDVGPAQGLKHESSIHCDVLVSVSKSALSDYLGTLPPALLRQLDQALRIALAVE
ncbi:MAG: type II toxin-antitoxin system PemK/MazF family toxin [Deltaproteobacteria bacterium]|nr:type II toxin-antitoxin system PemK/MazF family toxin [Deltaproteobacteria bacterium]